MRFLSQSSLAKTWAALCCACLLAAGCSQADPGPMPSSKPATAATPLQRSSDSAPRETLLAWGAGPQQLGFRAAAPEVLAAGPSAVAVLPNGDGLVLDTLRQRVLRIDRAGGVQEVAATHGWVEDLFAAQDGAFGVFSPLQSKIWVHNPQGELVGEVTVPRLLRDVQTLSFGGSHHLLVRTAFQETFDLGSPKASKTVDAILHSKKEGAAFLSTGSGVAVERSKEGRIDLVVLGRDSTTEKTSVVRRWQIAEQAAAGRLLGVVDSLVCLRLEHVASTPELAVRRSALCVDADTGTTQFQTRLPEPGAYVPRVELALGGNEPRLVLLHPRAEGLALLVYDIVAGRGGQGGAP